jgi:hypothetical protein
MHPVQPPASFESAVDGDTFEDDEPAVNESPPDSKAAGLFEADDTAEEEAFGNLAATISAAPFWGRTSPAARTEPTAASFAGAAVQTRAALQGMVRDLSHVCDHLKLTSEHVAKVA